MTRRILLGAVTILAAVLVQSTVLSRLPLPGGAPDLLLVLVVAFALHEGPLSGTVTGFVAGLVADLGVDHELGRTAVVYTLVGYVAGTLHAGARNGGASHGGASHGGPVRGDRKRSTALAFVVVAVAAAAGVTLFAAEGVLLGDPRITGTAYARSMTSTVPYSVLLTPFVVPVIGLLLRRLDLHPLRR